MYHKKKLTDVIYKEEKVGKGFIIYVLGIGFTLLNRKIKVLILASTGCIAKDIRKSIMHQL